MTFTKNMIIRTPYGKATVFIVNRKTIRVRSLIGNVVFKLPKTEAFLLNKA